MRKFIENITEYHVLPLWLAVLLFLPGGFFCPGILQAQPVILDSSLDTVRFGNRVMYLEDKSGNITLADIVQEDLVWEEAGDSATLNFGFTGSVYWFRFTVDNQLNREQEWYFELTYPLLDFIELYAPQKNELFKKITAGDHYPFSHREFPDKNFVFRLTPPPGKSTYYVRVETATSLNFEPIMHSYRAYRDQFHKVYPIFWVYYGAMLIMVIYNLVLFSLIRELHIIYLAVFIFMFLLLQFSLNGFAFQFLWPDAIWWANNCIPMFICLTVFFLLIFVRDFVNLQELAGSEGFDKFMRYGVMGPNLLWVLICLFTGNYALNIKVSTMLAAYSILVTVGGGTVLVRNQFNRSVRFIGLSCGVLVVGVLLYIGKTYGILPANFITNWSIQIGSAVFISLLSIGLADKLTILKDELLATNANISLMLESISQKADGDLTRSIDTSREEEIGGILQERLQWFMDKFKALVLEVRNNANTLNASSKGLFDLSEKMLTETGEMSTYANSVAGSSEEMSSKMTAISSTMEQTAQNVNLIASSTEEMTSTVHEITANTESARETTAMAVTQSKKVSRRVDALGQAAEQISSVTETIAEISQKTNLLALNATIEAARAGESGRGFAVVAGEIKALARQTAEATQEINQQIEENRTITTEAVGEIKKITEIISRVDEIVSTIASSIEEQSSSTREIANNVSQVSQGVTDTNHSVAQCSKVANTVSRDVSALSGTSQHMNDNSLQIKENAAELARIADHLTGLMEKFQV